jgi:hypothetical protein
MYLLHIYSVFQCVYNIFQCINSMFQCISMYLNVFINIVIGISPSQSHCSVFATHTHLDMFFSLYTMTPFTTCYTTTILFFHFHWSIPTFIQSMKKLHINPYFSRLYITPHSMFHIPRSMLSLVARSIAKPKSYISIAQFLGKMFRLTPKILGCIPSWIAS